ncbi:Vps54-like protein-domain-containing protein [Crucibulum laeve]|uniref:Vps54-like protein-domain-containing protein n=1 Tax=Crucibulum laeve TaxID=68775 RepID=A0A5C3MBR2_9AGAR|nr:Vps54-like protein-domain-containing protein [Crucibulum laeve]
MSEISSLPSRPGSPATSVVPEQIHTARPYRFTWDPASRRPGPESVSGTTEGRGVDYFNQKPVLGFLNTSTTNLPLASLPTEWSSSKHGFHAISTVLNNPHKRQAPPKAHSSLPAVPPADLPRVRRKDFDPYLRAIGPEWERFQHNTQLGREGQAQIDNSQWTPRPSIASDTGSSMPMTPLRSSALSPIQGKTIPPLDSVPKVFFDPKFNLGDSRTFNAVTEQEVPTSFSSFDQRDEFNDIFSLSHSLPLMEKFSAYADTVEQHLVREISLRSTSFFAALTNLQDLQSESEQCLDRIGRLRGLLKDVDTNQAKKGLELVRNECKMDNVARVKEGVKMVSGVVELTGIARGLVSAGQWGEALGIIEEMEKMWEVEQAPLPATPATARPERTSSLQNWNGNGNGNGRLTPLPATPEETEEDAREDTHMSSTPSKSPSSSLKTINPIPLSSLHAFSALPTHLRALTMEIASSLSSELVSVLRDDLHRRIDGSSGSSGGNANESLKDRLKPLLQGLLRTKGLKEGMLSWREVVLVEVREVIKTKVPVFEGEEGEEGERGNGNRNVQGLEGRPGLANHLRNMPHPEFMLLIQDIYRSLLNGIQGLQVQGSIITEVLESIKPASSSSASSVSLPTSSTHSPPSSDIPALEEELQDILSSAAELSNTQAAKIISYRGEQHAALDLPEFLTFFNDSWAFVVKCEVICKRMIVGLRGTVVSQAKVFLQQFHQARISRSAKLVEDEQWNPSEVSPALQHVADILVDSAVRDSPELIIKSDEAIFSPPPTNSFGSSSNGGYSPALPSAILSKAFDAAQNTTANQSAKNGAAAKHIRIEERTYFVVSATAEVLTLLLDYLRIIVNLTMLTTDTMSRVIEFLKAFNSRTCQVVLGAGAMRSAGLKNITAKHLALASQSLSIVFELIPYVRETFRRHLSQKQAVMLVEFDKLKRDYQEHQNEIHAKLIAIMGDRLSAHIRTLQAVDWNVPKPGGGVNDYMEILVKETVTLHKVLSRYLTAPIVEYVMTQVFAAINHRLSEEYGKIELPHQEAKTRLLADAKYLHQKLTALKNVGAPTGMLETVVTEKSIPRVNNAPIPTPTRSNTLTANQRLKGLLSGRSSTVDKALPTPTRSPTPPAVPTPPEKLFSTGPSSTISLNGSGVTSTEGSSLNGSSLALSTPPIQNTSTSSLNSENPGFKQVQDDASPTPEQEPPPPETSNPPPSEGSSSSLPPPPPTERDPEDSSIPDRAD